MFGWYSQYRHVIDNHSEISDESDRCWWNHKCYDTILSYTLTLVANLRKSVFTKFEAFLWIKMSWIPIFSLKLPSKHWCAMMHKWTLDHSRKKRGRGGITTRLPFHYLKRFIPSLIRKITFETIFIAFSLSNEMDDQYIETNCHSIIITVDSRYYVDSLLHYIEYNVENAKHTRGPWATSLTWEKSS